MKKFPDRHDGSCTLRAVDRNQATGRLLELVDQHAGIEQHSFEMAKRGGELQSLGGHSSGARVYGIDRGQLVGISELGLETRDCGSKPFDRCREITTRGSKRRELTPESRILSKVEESPSLSCPHFMMDVVGGQISNSVHDILSKISPVALGDPTGSGDSPELLALNKPLVRT